jgi:HEAT repeat protein
MTRLRFLCLVCPALLLVCSAASHAQQLAFEDVVRNLRNPDPELRISAVRLLREARYPEGIVAMSAVVNDPVNDIQLEVIAAHLGFFLVDDVPKKRKIAFLGEMRADRPAARAFDMGPLAAWPKPAPPELVKALLNAADDENADVRLEAIYTLGVIGGRGIGDEDAKQLAAALDHPDPAVRAATARVIGRLRIKTAGENLIKAMNDSNAQVRYASMRALGEIGEPRAVQALTDQFNYYGKGEGAFSALEALARIAHPSSVELFKTRLTDKDPLLRRAAAEGLGRSGYVSAADALQTAATTDASDMVRAAVAFALKKQGQSYLGRMMDFLNHENTAPQVQSYLLEIGPSIVAELIPRLQEPGETGRRFIAETLGALGDATTIAALTPLLQDRDEDVKQAATHAIARIKMRMQ